MTAPANAIPPLPPQQERIAAACGRPVDDLVADMRAGRLLDAAEARAHGLADAAEPIR